MAFTLGSAEGALNSTSFVTVVASPASGVTRQVSMIRVHNVDTVSHNFTVRFNNGTGYPIHYQTLAQNEQFVISGFVLNGTSDLIEVAYETTPTTTQPNYSTSYADFS